MQLKIRALLFFFLIILFPIFVTGTVLAADFKVTGTAIDNKNDPVAHATITVVDISTQKVVTTTTSDQNGYYTFFVSKGTYDITTNPPVGSGLQQSVNSHLSISSDMSLHNDLNAAATSSNVPESTKGASFGRWMGLTVLGALLIVILAAVGFAFLKRNKSTNAAK